MEELPMQGVMLRREAVAKQIDAIIAKMFVDPSHCYVPNNKFVKLRGKEIGKNFIKCSIRSLVYYRINEKVPMFGTPRCGTTGCINPKHQQSFLESQRYKVKKVDGEIDVARREKITCD